VSITAKTSMVSPSFLISDIYRNGLGGVAGSYIVRATESPTYITAVWVSIASHIAIIMFVVGFSAFFYLENKAAQSGKVLEGVEGFRYTF
jgi:hypothetical protein